MDGIDLTSEDRRKFEWYLRNETRVEWLLSKEEEFKWFITNEEKIKAIVDRDEKLGWLIAVSRRVAVWLATMIAGYFALVEFLSKRGGGS